MDRKATNNIL
jgi:hypothetical protein